MKEIQLAKGESDQLLAGHKSDALHLRLQSVKKIEFKHLQVTSETLHNLANTLFGLRFESFVMSHCVFDRDCILPFSVLLKHVGVERLYFDNNQFNHVDILSFLQEVPNYLSHLSIVGNHVDDETAIAICKLANTRQIISLDLSQNKLSAPADTIERMLSALEGGEVKRLALRNNHIGQDVQQIGYALQHYSVALDYLDLSYNDLGAQIGEIDVFLQALLQGASVKVANLSFNSIFISYSLLPFFRANQSLTHIELNAPILLGAVNLQHNLNSIKEKDINHFRLHGAYLRYRLTKIKFRMHEQIGNQVATHITTIGPLRRAFLHGFNQYQLEKKQPLTMDGIIEQPHQRRRVGKLGRLCKRFAKIIF